MPGIEKTQILINDKYVPNESVENRFDKFGALSLNSIYPQSEIFDDLCNNDLLYKMNDE